MRVGGGRRNVGDNECVVDGVGGDGERREYEEGVGDGQKKVEDAYIAQDKGVASTDETACAARVALMEQTAQSSGSQLRRLSAFAVFTGCLFGQVCSRDPPPSLLLSRCGYLNPAI